MDRTQAFVEYGAILKKAEEWLDGGYRGGAEEMAVVPPASSASVPLPQRIDESTASDTLEPPSFSDSAELLRIASEIRNCRDCNIHLTRENTVPGIGGVGAQLMVVTPSPADSAQEDDTPLPSFEDEYLWKWLTALELSPGRDVFITPAVKCRTPGGRPPHPREVAACTGYLRRQYKAVAPRAVLALGAAACGALTGDAADFPMLVGKEWTWGAVPALVLWTPAEVLANPGRLRSPVWEALKRLKAAWNALP